MNKYWLCQNLLFNCTHVKKVNFWRKMFGTTQIKIAECEAVNEYSARKKFKLMGYQVGVGF